MIKQIKILGLTLGLILGLMLSQTSAALVLNGIASYENLRKEFYIASLYATNPSSAPLEIINSNQSKRMAIKVTAQRWSPRRWSLMWQNDIAINNPYASDEEIINQLMTFSGFLEKPLIAGDEVIIDYIATQGTSVFINNIKIMQTTTAQLFNHLLNAWIGKYPPSGEFKKQILNTTSNADSQALKTRYSSINYVGERSRLITSWIQSRKDAEQAALKAKAKALAKKAKKEEERKKALALKNKKEKAKKVAKNKKTKKTVVAVTKPKPVKTYVAPKKTVKKKKISKKTKIASVKVSKKSLTKKQKAAHNKYYQALYQWELRREIRNAVTYPQWAQRFGQKGTVKANFTVNRKAQVSKLSNGGGATSELLISEVQKAIKNVVPFILPPDALSGKEWPITFSYVFNPKDDAQPYLKKPKKPSSLVSSSKISRTQYKQILSQYIDEVKKDIEQRIEYPNWAKKLNQKGVVEIEITIDREGSVKSHKEITVTRHKTLNQEVLNAIETSQPLPPIPEMLKLNSTTLRVKHKFK